MVRVVRATQVEIETAVQALRDGELVSFPTETVYGLGANAQNPAAVSLRSTVRRLRISTRVSKLSPDGRTVPRCA